jgi:hypothetical protein
MPDQSWFLLQLPGSLRELLKWVDEKTRRLELTTIQCGKTQANKWLIVNTCKHCRLYEEVPSKTI